MKNLSPKVTVVFDFDMTSSLKILISKAISIKEVFQNDAGEMALS